MSIQIDIPETSLKITKAAIAIAAAEVVKRVNDSIKEWESIQPVLSQLGIEVMPPLFPESAKRTLTIEDEVDLYLINYESNWTWEKKAKYVLRKTGKAMTAKEIIEILIKDYEPDLNREKAGNSLPATLSVAAKDNKINRRQIEGGEFEYMA